MRATYDLKVQHIICCPNPLSIIVLLYFLWLRIKYSTHTIHKQTDHDQTGLDLDELIWDELASLWINSDTITPVHVIQVANNKLTQLGTNWFRTKLIQNESTCLWRQTRHSGPTSVFICPRSNIDFICPLRGFITPSVLASACFGTFCSLLLFNFYTTCLAKDHWRGFSTRNAHMVHIVILIRLKWRIHLRRNLFLNLNNFVSVTAGGPVSPRGHM